MAWEVEYTNEFETWWEGLTADEQEDVNAKVLLLQQFGPGLKRPHTDVIASSLSLQLERVDCPAPRAAVPSPLCV